MTDRVFDASLKDLKGRLFSMAVLVERAIDLASETLLIGDTSKISEISQVENQINRSHVRNDELFFTMLALQHPFAADLRAVLAMFKINADLERMGDQAMNIAYNSELYLKRKSLKPLIDLPKMFDEVRFMVRETIEAFLRDDVDMARDVLKRDEQVDYLKNKIFRDVLDHTKGDPEMVEQGLTLILIARNLERIGDHATNIAEDVIFAVTGQDVRHTRHDLYGSAPQKP